jgi:hypothetical protein
LTDVPRTAQSGMLSRKRPTTDKQGRNTRRFKDDSG